MATNFGSKSAKSTYSLCLGILRQSGILQFRFENLMMMMWLRCVKIGPVTPEFMRVSGIHFLDDQQFSYVHLAVPLLNTVAIRTEFCVAISTQFCFTYSLWGHHCYATWATH